MAISMDELKALSTRHRQRGCKIAAALNELDPESRVAVEAGIADPTVSDGAVTDRLRDETEAMKGARGPQSVTFHRTQRCVCYEKPDDE